MLYRQIRVNTKGISRMINMNWRLKSMNYMNDVHSDYSIIFILTGKIVGAFFVGTNSSVHYQVKACHTKYSCIQKGTLKAFLKINKYVYRIAKYKHWRVNESYIHILMSN